MKGHKSTTDVNRETVGYSYKFCSIDTVNLCWFCYRLDMAGSVAKMIEHISPYC